MDIYVWLNAGTILTNNEDLKAEKEKMKKKLGNDYPEDYFDRYLEPENY